MLLGTLEGIRLDYEINDAELQGLRDWLAEYRRFHAVHPFDEVVELLDAVLLDGKIDEAEHQELLEWCDWFLSRNSPSAQCLDGATRRLHGVLQGVAIDGKVTAQEVVDLQEWLADYGDLRGYFPFDAAVAIVDGVLADGVVSDEERQDVLAFCREFAETPSERVVDPDRFNTKLSGGGILVQSIDMVCAREPEIVVRGRCFCFTGKSKFGKRKDLHDLVRSLGGEFSAGVGREVSFLVVGDLSSPHWTFSTYGRKVQHALDRSIPIVREDDFMVACESARGS